MKPTCPTLLFVSLSALACRGPAPLPVEPLPFHVALAPAETLDADLPTIEAREAAYTTRAEVEAREPARELELRLDSESVTHGLAQALAHGFARVTVLDPPAEPGLVSASDEQRAAYWHEQALAAGADLWVQPSVQYEPHVTRETNEKFWLNLPLFLLGGPFCYFVGDNTYRARVQLNADFIDSSSPREDPLGANVLRVPIQVEFDSTDLRFIDRANDVGDYLLSIVVPAGFLSRSTTEVVEEVRKKLIEEISASFVREVHESARFFTRSDRLAAVDLAHESVLVERLGPEVSVALPVTARSYVLAAGDTEIRAEVPAEREADGHQWIRQRIAVDPRVRFLRLRLLDARSEPRTYTLRIPDGELVAVEPGVISASAGGVGSARAGAPAPAGRRP